MPPSDVIDLNPNTDNSSGQLLQLECSSEDDPMEDSESFSDDYLVSIIAARKQAQDNRRPHDAKIALLQGCQPISQDQDVRSSSSSYLPQCRKGGFFDALHKL